MSDGVDLRDYRALLAQSSRALEKLQAKLDRFEQADREPIAIVGIGCRFPGGADSPDAYWTLLRDGVDAVGEIPPDRWDADAYYDPDPSAPGKMSTRWGGFLDRVDQFDARFFGISAREAERMDPQHRMVLEVAFEALEDGGLPLERIQGSRTGVFIGVSTTDYSILLGSVSDDPFFSVGNSPSVMVGRVAYLFDLKGPALALDTACSSSLVAVHLACQSLRRSECDAARAGGVNVLLSRYVMTAFSKGGFMAADGRCKTFDARADGYVRAEGCGILALKRLRDALADGDRIWALVRGSAMGQDGRSAALTAPNLSAQRAVLRAALADAGLEPADIGYIEAHGTGTSLGDPIEIEALSSVLGRPRPDGSPCWVGSVKTNFGHLEAAAGVAGVVKAILALHHEGVPPHLNMRRLNPRIALEGTPFEIPVDLQPWLRAGRPRRAGVSSFGFSGTNAHVILEEAPADPGTVLPREAAPTGPLVLPLSARSQQGLVELARSWVELLRAGSDDLDALCWTAAVRRTHHPRRLAVVGRDSETLAARLEEAAFAAEAAPARPAVSPRLAFVFSGQGCQWPGMGAALESVSQSCVESLKRLDALFAGEGVPGVRALLCDEAAAERLADTEVAQPAIFAVQVTLAALWRSWGIHPHAVVGHSVGEVAAAHVAGALGLEDAVRVVARRGRAMQPARGCGGMVAVALSPEEAERELASGVEIAAINAPRSVVLSGELSALAEQVSGLESRGVSCRPVRVDYAFHSAQMEPFRVELESALDELEPRASDILFISSVTGEKEPGSALDASYWGRNLREPVRFAGALDALLADGCGSFLELGGHPVLLPAIAGRCEEGGGDPGVVLGSLRRGRPGREVLLESLAALYATGLPVDWEALHGARQRPAQLPRYPWQREHYWIDAESALGSAPEHRLEGPAEDEVPLAFYEVAWRPVTDAPAPDVTGESGTFWLLFEDRRGVGASLRQHLLGDGARVIRVETGPDFADLGVDAYALDPSRRDHFERLAGELSGPDGARCAGIVHLWSLDTPEPASEAEANAALDLSCGSALHLTQAFSTLSWQADGRLWLVTRGAQPVRDDEESVAPAQASLWGFAVSLAAEHPELRSTCIDLDPLGPPNLSASKLAAELAAPTHDELAFRDGQRLVRRLVVASLSEAAGNGADASSLELRPDARYLVAGGAGLEAAQLARWLVASGARHLTLLDCGESDAWDAAALEALGELSDAEITREDLDPADAEALGALLLRLAEEGPPLRGVIHARRHVELDPLHRMDRDRLLSLAGSSIRGAWNLHVATAELEIPLDFFVLFCSAAGLLESTGLAHCAAASAFMDSLAAHRRGRALPALAVDWSPWRLAGTGEAPEGWAIRGLRGVAAEAALVALERLLIRGAPARVAALRLDLPAWERDAVAGSDSGLLDEVAPREGRARRRATPLVAELAELPNPAERSRRLRSHLRGEVGDVLGVHPERVDTDWPLADLGFDSMMTLDLKNRLQRQLGIRLSTTLLFGYPTLERLEPVLLRMLGLTEPAAGDSETPRAPVGSDARSLEGLLEEIEGASDEDVRRMLEEGA